MFTGAAKRSYFIYTKKNCKRILLSVLNKFIFSEHFYTAHEIFLSELERRCFQPIAGNS